MRKLKPKPYKSKEPFKLADWDEEPEEDLSIDDMDNKKFKDNVSAIHSLRKKAGT